MEIESFDANPENKISIDFDPEQLASIAGPNAMVETTLS